MNSGSAGNPFERNATLYPWYAAAFNALFWLPVFFLYFSRHVSLEAVLRLEAIYYASVVLLEIPSGYFSDTVGRRPTLLISAAAILVAHVLFVLGSGFGFGVFAAAQVFLAAGIAFNSGTDTSFHYDSLAAVGRAGEFGAREAAVARNSFAAGAVAALLGGAAGVIDLRAAYLLAALAGAAAFAIAVAFVEPTSSDGPGPRRGMLRQVGHCIAYLRQAPLRWLFAFVLLMTVLNHVPYEFYQPYLDLLARDLDLPGRGTPLASGVVTAVTMLAGGWIAARSIRIRDRIGTARTLLAACGMQVVIILVMGLLVHPVVVVLILLRSAPRGLMTAPLNAAIVPRIEQSHRATYLSIQSLAGRLSFSGTLLGLSFIAGAGSAGESGAEISLMLKVGAGLGLAGLIVLAVTARNLMAERPG